MDDTTSPMADNPGAINLEPGTMNCDPVAINLEPDAINCVSTAGGFAGNKNPLLNQNISRVIRWYKGRCTFEIRKNHADFS